ncbi:MAG: hypothetical protein GY716_06375 [bacterium]|nr:hypothetical protein [bacterium]
MTTQTLDLANLDTHIAAVEAAGTPAEVFKAILQGARTLVPRAAVFLVRQGHAKGWGSVGYPQTAAQQLRSYSAPAASGWLGQAASLDTTALLFRRGAGGDPDFGQDASAESVAIAVRVRNRAIALLVAERSPSESEWFPDGLTLLVRVAQLRLELDILRRKLESAQAGAAASAIRPPEPTTPAPAGGKVEVDEETLTAARRFAKLVATDIRLYNEDAVAQGKRQGDLVERLGEHLGRGKEMFLKRHGDLPTAKQILRDAYVEVLAGGDSALVPTSVVD